MSSSSGATAYPAAGTDQARSGVARGREWHLFTGEYPPQHGGVADYSRHVAEGLVGAGERVHVWCPGGSDLPTSTGGVSVHRSLGAIAPGDLRRVGAELDRFPGPRRLLVQWVPHAFGFQAMNVAFCAWLLARVKLRGDEVYLMVHEAAVEFGGTWKQYTVAAVHRAMTALLLQAAIQVWVGTPAWGDRMRPFRLGRRTSFDWLPVPANIPRVRDDAESAEVHRRLADGRLLVGHFGTYGRLIAPLLDGLLPPLLRGRRDLVVMLMGRGNAGYLQEFRAREPELAERVVAPDSLDDRALSTHIAACDLFVQPYPEGVNSRRGSAMAVVGHGRPMITTSGPFTEGVWEEYGASILVPRGDMDRLAAATLQAAGDADLLQRLSAGAERLYAERFDVRFTVEAVIAAGDRRDEARAGRGRA